MKVVVTGAAGMLGHDLMSELTPRYEAAGVTRGDADLCDLEAVRKLLKALGPEVVVHAAAYTDVDGCETHPVQAGQNNAQATLHVALACREIGAGLIFISTDYVFDGRKIGAYAEDDATHPLSVYGQSKLRGEQHVRETLEDYLILRTSWLFGAHGKNFVDTIRRLASERDELRVVHDQRGSPTYTRHLAKAISCLIARKPRGILNVTGSGECTWFEFAQAIVQWCAPGRVRVNPITSSEIARPAPRPANSVLDNSRFLQTGCERLPTWQEALRQYLDTAASTAPTVPPALAAG